MEKYEIVETITNVYTTEAESEEKALENVNNWNINSEDSSKELDIEILN